MHLYVLICASDYDTSKPQAEPSQISSQPSLRVDQIKDREY
jgi:hypothetical protein